MKCPYSRSGPLKETEYGNNEGDVKKGVERAGCYRTVKAEGMNQKSSHSCS